MIDKNIQIKNVYYMLAYAFTSLKRKQFEEIEKEDFDNIHDLFAVILAKGVAQQIKQGLYREYITNYDELSTIRGKIDIRSSLKLKLKRKQQLACEFDELSVNNIFNQVIKSTMLLLLKIDGVKTEHKKMLRRLEIYFKEIDEINMFQIRWDMLKFQRNNQTYKMLMNICYFVCQGLIYSETSGNYRVESFLDSERMCSLYERFVLEYYKHHYNGKIESNSSQIKWNYDESQSTSIEFLPKMQSDIMLRANGKTLIIDAKYYSHTMQQGQFDKRTFHSHNMYQIFTYVKNYDKLGDGSVSGMLLYAKTDELIQPDGEIMFAGNKISIKTLDLNISFTEIRSQLDQIIQTYFTL